MFGNHRYVRKKNKKEKRKQQEKVDAERLKNQNSAEAIQREKNERESIRQEASEQTKKLSDERDAARQKGRAYADEVLSRNYEGLNPRERQSIEETGKAKLNRDVQGYQRQLLANQGRSGIRGGAAYAQQADLSRAGLEAQQQLYRDIENLNAQRQMQKLAAAFNIEQGEAAQSQADRQLSMDELRYDQERKRQKTLEDQINYLFSKV